MKKLPNTVFVPCISCGTIRGFACKADMLRRSKTGKCRNCFKSCKRPYMTGELNPRWKGENITYEALHGWLRKHLIYPKKCQDCGKDKPLDLANISQQYRRDASDWEFLCRSCHMKKDGRLMNLQAVHRLKLTGKPSWNKGLKYSLRREIK